MFYSSHMGTSAMMLGDVQGGMKKMVMFRHLNMKTKIVNQKFEALGFINPFNSKRYHFEKDAITIAEVKSL